MSIKKLITECINDNKEAWEILVRTYANFVKNIISHHIANKSDVDDIMQEVFVRLLKNDRKLLKTFKGETEYSFLAYLKTIVLSTLKNYLKKYSRDFTAYHLSSTIPDNIFNPEEEAVKKMSINRLKTAIMKLPLIYRDIFFLLLKGYKHREIAGILNISINTVSTRIKRGKEKLQNILKENY